VKLDKRQVSRDLANIMLERLEDYGIGLRELRQMTGLPKERLEQLSKGRVFRSLEIQVVAGALGIGMGEIFPFEPLDRKTQLARIREIRMAGGGIAPLRAGRSSTRDTPSRTKLQQSLLRLDHYVKCLRAFK